MKKTIYLLAILFITISTTNAQNASPQANFPKAELEITLTPLSKPNTFHLSAIYHGDTSVVIVRPRTRILDYFESWGGWGLRIQGSGGAFQPFPYPAGVPPFTSLDLIELRTGESVGVIFDLSKYIRKGMYYRDIPMLADLPGKYTVVASYYLDQDKVYVPASGGDGVSVPRLRSVESAPLQFTVQGKRK